MSNEEKRTLEKYRTQWNLFKRMRSKKKFNNTTGNGWLSMLNREDMLDFLMNLVENENLIACG